MIRLASRNALATAAVAGLGVLALAQHWLADRRPAAAEDRVAGEIVVTSGEDRGAGSLREAIFAADTASGRVRILVRTARITLRSPLPPLVNPEGISIEGAQDGAEIDLALVAAGPAFEVRGAKSQLVGLVLTRSPGQAIRVAAPDFRLTNGRIEDCAEGVQVLAGAAQLVVEKMAFARNGIGIRIESTEPGMVVRENRFSSHREAAVWVVRPADAAAAGSVTVTGNVFDADRTSVVAGNAPVRIERNEFARNSDNALLVLGAGVAVVANQVHDGDGIGIFAHGAAGVVIEGNEVSRNRALGVLVRGSGGATVRNNRIYGNGYGMGFVLGEGANPVTVSDNAVLNQRYDGIVVIGDSPVVRGNRALHNGQAGLRVLDIVSANAARVAAKPYLDANRLSGNLIDGVARGEYRLEPRRPQ